MDQRIPTSLISQFSVGQGALVVRRRQPCCVAGCYISPTATPSVTYFHQSHRHGTGPFNRVPAGL